jgi:hypothetical protein
VERPRRRGADEPDGELERDEGERRKDNERKREENDVTAGRAAHGEERRVLAEDVEERLRKRKCAERGQLGAAAGDRVETPLFTTPIPCRHQSVTYFRLAGPTQSAKGEPPHMHLAYIDPASGSMLLQIILGGAAAVAVALKMQWRRFLRFLRIRKPEDDVPAESISAASENEALDPVREPVGKR